MIKAMFRGKRIVLGIIVLIVCSFLCAPVCEAKKNHGGWFTLPDHKVSAKFQKGSCKVKPIDVPADFATIQEAIDAVDMCFRRGVINVAPGTYSETLVIDGKEIMLVGAGKESTIIQGSGSTTDDTVVSLSNGQLDISGFTIRGGRWGILSSASFLQCHNNEINGSFRGVDLYFNSTAFVDNTGVSNNLERGIALSASSAYITNCTLTANGDSGLFVSGSSNAIVDGCTISSNNPSPSEINRFQVMIASSSSAILSRNTISGNQSGVLVFSASALTLLGENNISSNAQCGIIVASGAALYVDQEPEEIVGSTGPDIISNNGQSGISVTRVSAAYLKRGIIDANGVDGVVLSYNSGGSFGNGVSITRNGRFGLFKFYGSVIQENSAVFGEGGMANAVGEVGCHMCLDCLPTP